MEIRERKGYFLLKSKAVLVGLCYLDSPQIKDKLDVCINFECPESYNIATPGEYEIKDVFVQVLEKKGRKQYVITIEDVNILLIDSSIHLTDQEIENIGAIDILILKGEIELKMDLVKFVNDLDPNILILEKDVKEEEKIEGLFGAPVRKVGSKYKITSTDFEVEDYKLEIFKLDEEGKE